jgi:hypothetical protein
MVGFVVWVGELFLFARVIDHEGRSDNFDGVVANVALLATLAVTMGAWIGFVYARRSSSDRGMASDLDSIAHGFGRLADAIRGFDKARANTVSMKLARVLSEVIHTPPISERCG